MGGLENVTWSLASKSDQLNADQLLAAPMVITVTAVKLGTEEQPLIINYHNDNGRPYKPCKSMRKILAFAWGENALEWVGKSMELFCDRDVTFGKEKVGGIRISKLSDIPSAIELPIMVTRGKKKTFRVEVLKNMQQQQQQPQATLLPVEAIPSYIAEFIKTPSLTDAGIKNQMKQWGVQWATPEIEKEFYAQWKPAQQAEIQRRNSAEQPRQDYSDSQRQGKNN